MLRPIATTQLPSSYDKPSAYEFLKKQTYQEAGALVYLTLTMVQFVQSLQNLFCAIFEATVTCHLCLQDYVKVQKMNANFLLVGRQNVFSGYRNGEIIHESLNFPCNEMWQWVQ